MTRPLSAPCHCTTGWYSVQGSLLKRANAAQRDLCYSMLMLDLTFFFFLFLLLGGLGAHFFSDFAYACFVLGFSLLLVL